MSMLDPAEHGACLDVVLSIGAPPSLQRATPKVLLAPPATCRALFRGFTIQPLGDGPRLAFPLGAAPPGLPSKGRFTMSHMSQLNFLACATVGRAGATKYLFLAHMWALLGMGRIVMAGTGGGGGGGSMGARLNQISGLGAYNPDTANKGGYGEKVTGMPRRGVKDSSAGQRARWMAGGHKVTVEAEILRSQDETRRRMGEPEEEPRTAVRAVEMRAARRTMVYCNFVLINSF